ncbi:ROK family protein [Leifsonia sp. SIMBA_070]|uniref:ROK family protein n=1 Tax=Leifsonia sp. SIMBA_070 TaxID=3085810 RepID=UPI00397E4459
MIVGVETGGTKVVCATANEDDPSRPVHSETFPTADPAPTIERIRGYLREAERRGGVSAIGVASFGPLDADARSPRYGTVTSTPKPGWSGTDLLSPLLDVVDVPAAFTTDVNAAAVAEHRARGANPGNFAYVTVGTGIGAGILIDGALMGGSGYPEVAHLEVVRHPDDRFAGVCRFHGDCLEGLASGPAVSRRWGADGSSLPARAQQAAIRLEAFYLAQLATTLRYVVGTDLMIVGGGVAKTPGLIAAVADRLAENDGAAGGSGRPPLQVEPPAMPGRSGVIGALQLAADALAAAGDLAHV